MRLSRVQKIQQSKIFFICFSIENFIENISLYALSWPKLNFGCYLTFEIFFKLYFNGKTNNFFLDCWIFFTRDKYNLLPIQIEDTALYFDCTL